MGYGPAFRRRVDENHKEVRDEYRRLGCVVEDVHGGHIGDLFVKVPCSICRLLPSCTYHTPRVFFVEVKKDDKEELTKNEKKWALLLGDQFVIVRSLNDVWLSINKG